MDPIYSLRSETEGKHVLEQREVQGRPKTRFELRWTIVSAVNLATARWIQRDYINDNGPIDLRR